MDFQKNPAYKSVNTWTTQPVEKQESIVNNSSPITILSDLFSRLFYKKSGEDKMDTTTD